jgi:hypothetical protein
MAVDYTGSSTTSTTNATTLGSVDFTKLDFNDIKSSLKSFLQKQDLFTDYNFDGSALSILLDVLSYNTMYYSFYANMIANEMFLDSATQRDNVVSLSKMLGYVPKSRTCASAKLELKNVSGSEQSIVRGKQLANANGVQWFFWGATGFTLGSGLTANAVVYGSNGLVQGEGGTIIGDRNVDTDTLRLTVNDGVTAETWTLMDSNIVSGLNGDDKIYFVDSTYDNYYTVKFGDGVFGKAVTNNAIITKDYLIGGNGNADNGVVVFSQADSNVNINKVVLPSSGGSEEDTLDDIKYYAPAFFQSQNRAVTKLDYDALIRKDLRTVTSVNIWGGEENNPPQYGRVFVSTTSSSAIDTKKIVDIVKTKSVISIIPEYVAPKYSTIHFRNFTVEYDKFNTAKSASEIRDLVRTLMGGGYQFGLIKSSLLFENLNKDVLGVEKSVVGLDYFLIVSQNTSNISPSGSYMFDFGQSVRTQNAVNNDFGQVIYSSEFAHADYAAEGSVFYIQNGADGVIDLYSNVDGVRTLVTTNVGTYNSETGFIYLRDVQASENFTVYYEPRSKNVVSKRNIVFQREADWPNTDHPITIEEI